MARSNKIVQGRKAFSRRNWKEAYQILSAADRERPLNPTDLERLASAAYLVGEDTAAITAWTRLHHDLIENGEQPRAAYWGFRLSLHMLLAGEMARATGWLARSQRLLKNNEGACVAQGYGFIVTGLLDMGSGNTGSAGDGFEQAIILADQFGDPDLKALGLLSRGQSLIQSQKISEGVSRLDEAMLAVTTGEVSPVLAGMIYCAVILTCQDIFDLRRAREWTIQFDAWCATQPELVPYRGQCLVHRSEILQLQGDWSRALIEAGNALDHLADRSEGVVGRACYQQGELHRLLGEFDQADEYYRAASRSGFDPQPGLALMRLAQGKSRSALLAIRRSLDSVSNPLRRLRLLPVAVEINLSTGSTTAARHLYNELKDRATQFNANLIKAATAGALARIHIAEGNPDAALPVLNQATELLHGLQMPYDLARVYELTGQACSAIGDPEGARSEFSAALELFHELGAKPDQSRTEQLLHNLASAGNNPLTQRQTQILQLVAEGMTNRDIARQLDLSERTVDRHVSDILTRLSVSTRTAATSCGLAQGLISPPRSG